MKKPLSRAATALLVLMTAACDDSLVAQEKPVAPPRADEPTTPLPPSTTQRPIDEGAIRALAEEVARLRAQIAELQKAQPAPLPAPATPSPALVEPVEAPPPAPAEAAQAKPVETQTTIVERETYVEREVPVYVETPVYVESEVYVEQAPTVVIETVTCGDTCFDQWIPYGHVHFIGCGHHYYGCSCHPWYYSLGPSISLSFHCDDHHRGHDRHGDWGGAGRSAGRDRHDGDRRDGAREGRGRDRSDDDRRDRDGREGGRASARTRVERAPTPAIVDSAPSTFGSEGPRRRDDRTPAGSLPQETRTPRWGEGSPPAAPGEPTQPRGRGRQRDDDEGRTPRAAGEERRPRPETPRIERERRPEREEAPPPRRVRDDDAQPQHRRRADDDTPRRREPPPAPPPVVSRRPAPLEPTTPPPPPKPRKHRD